MLEFKLCFTRGESGVNAVLHVVFNMYMNWCLSGVFHLLLLIVTCSKLSGKIGVNTEYVVVDLWCRSRVQKGERWCK